MKTAMADAPRCAVLIFCFRLVDAHSKSCAGCTGEYTGPGLANCFGLLMFAYLLGTARGFLKAMRV